MQISFSRNNLFFPNYTQNSVQKSKNVQLTKLQTLPTNDTFKYNNTITFKGILTPSKKITLKTKDGEKIQATLKKPCKNTYNIMIGDESAGSMFMSSDDAPIIGIPENYKGKKYLFINHLRTNPEYKGAGKVLIQAAIEESKKRGFEGRVCTNASAIDPDYGSPVGFYFSQGFKTTNPELNVFLVNYDKIPKDIPATTMYYEI